MKKFNLLLFDTDVIIELFRQGIWDNIVGECDVHVAETVVEEACYYDDNNRTYSIDLKKYGDEGKIVIFKVSTSDVKKFGIAFDPVYLEKLDPGETESLTYLMNLPSEARLCSADKIVYRVLGNLDRSSQGISLEEILKSLGLRRSLSHQFNKSYREYWTGEGVKERLQGMGKIKQ